MTPTQIEDHVRLRYNAVGDTFFTQAMIFDLIYAAQLELGWEADMIEQLFTAPSVADQREYTYPTNTVSIKRIEYDGDPLAKVELRDDPKSDTTEVTGTPDSYAIWNDVVYLFPTPDTAGEEIKMWTYQRAGSVTATSVLDVPEEFHMGIVDYILGVFFGKDKDRAMSTYHFNRWANTVEYAKRFTAKKKRSDRMAYVRDIDFDVVGALP